MGEMAPRLDRCASRHREKRVSDRWIVAAGKLCGSQLHHGQRSSQVRRHTAFRRLARDSPGSRLAGKKHGKKNRLFTCLMYSMQWVMILLPE